MGRLSTTECTYLPTQFWTFVSHSQDGLKQPICSPELLGDNDGAKSSA